MSLGLVGYSFGLGISGVGSSRERNVLGVGKIGNDRSCFVLILPYAQANISATPNHSTESIEKKQSGKFESQPSLVCYISHCNLLRYFLHTLSQLALGGTVAGSSSEFT